VTRLRPGRGEGEAQFSRLGIVQLRWFGVLVGIALPFGGCAPGAPAAEGEVGGAVGGAVGGTPRTQIETPQAPDAIGPYSQAILAGNTLYLAGQIGLNPETGAMVEGGIVAETRQVLDNLGAVLAAAGFTFDHVVQAQVFLVDLGEFGAMNEVYATYFGEAPPARATVGVASLPRGARVEILMTAVR